MTSTYLGVGAGSGQKSTYFSLGPSGGGSSNAFGGGEGRKPAAAGVSVYLGMPSGGAGAATSDYFDNTKTAIGGIPMDNTKTAIGGVHADGFGGAAPQPSFTPVAASSRSAAANQSVYLGLGGGSLEATQPGGAAVGVSVYLGMPSGGAAAATSDYFDNTKTAIGGIPMDNTKTAIGGIPMDDTKTAIGSISFDDTKTAIGGIPMDNTKTAIGGIPMDNTKTAIGGVHADEFGGAAPQPGFTPVAASSRSAAANQSVYLGLGGGSLGATQPCGGATSGGGKPAPGVSVYFAAPSRGAGGAPGVTSCYFAPK